MNCWLAEVKGGESSLRTTWIEEVKSLVYQSLCRKGKLQDLFTIYMDKHQTVAFHFLCHITS